MRVNDLPQWLQDLAWANCKQQNVFLLNDLPLNPDLVDMFVFYESNEGFTFWDKIYFENEIPQQDGSN